jgi:hypothetical protein
MQNNCLDLDAVRLENRAFRIYLSLIQAQSHQLACHMVEPEDLAARARDYVQAFYDFDDPVQEPSDPNLLQFEGVETVFGEFRVNGDEVWWLSSDGNQVMVASFSEQIWAIDAARELNERFNGYPVKVKDE